MAESPLTARYAGRECTDPPDDQCHDAGCPLHGWDRDDLDDSEFEDHADRGW